MSCSRVIFQGTRTGRWAVEPVSASAAEVAARPSLPSPFLRPSSAPQAENLRNAHGPCGFSKRANKRSPLAARRPMQQGALAWRPQTAAAVLHPAPTPELHNRYAQVPSVYSVIQGFSRSGSWLVPSERAVSAASVAAASVPATYTNTAAYVNQADRYDTQRRAWSAPIGADDEDDEEQEAGGAVVAKGSGKQWSLTSALERVRALLPLPAVAQLPQLPAHLPSEQERQFLRAYAAAGKGEGEAEAEAEGEGEDEAEDEGPAAGTGAGVGAGTGTGTGAGTGTGGQPRSLRSAGALSGLTSTVGCERLLAATKRCGALLLASLATMHPPAHAAGEQSANESMPDCTAEMENTTFSEYEESSAYDEERDDTRGEEEGYAYAHNYRLWQQDAFAALPSLLRNRPVEEFPALYRRHSQLQASLALAQLPAQQPALPQWPLVHSGSGRQLHAWTSAKGQRAALSAGAALRLPRSADASEGSGSTISVHRVA